MAPRDLESARSVAFKEQTTLQIQITFLAIAKAVSY